MSKETEEPSDLELLETVLDALEVAVLVRVDGEAGFRLAGTAPEWFASCFGSASELLERSPFLDDFVRGAAGDCWQRGGGTARSDIWEESAGEGEPRYFQARALKRGNLDVLLLELADERHRREQAFFQRAHDEALYRRRLAREREKKEILLDCIIHDLGSPLSTILMNIQHVERQVDRDDLRQSLIRAETQAERQRSLIRSIADLFSPDLSAFESVLLGGSSGVDIGVVAGEMVDAYQLEAEKRNVRLLLDTGHLDEAHRCVVGEADHLARVFDNLLSNAMRHSPERATVKVGIRCRDGRLLTTVDDEGPGISGNEKEQIFVPFSLHVGAEASAGDPEGAPAGNRGLGLYFCKMTVELWGGRIGLEARAGGGTRFWFELPEARRPAAEDAGGESKSDNGGEGSS